MIRTYQQSSHWGAFEVDVEDGDVREVRADRRDPDPSPLLGNIRGALRHPTRVGRPMVRAGWLDRGPGPDAARGAEPFVPLPWPEAVELLGGELERVIRTRGPRAVFGGSYGWGSAGRFHHAQSQVHRFLNCLGGFTRSVGSYSHGASTALLPHILGSDLDGLRGMTSWSAIAAHAGLVVAFGGAPLKNVDVAPGGMSRHTVRDRLRAVAANGVELAVLSPLADDLPELAGARWYPLVPGTDTAVMLALCHVLVTEGLYDAAFVDRYCVGFERFRRYLLGEDGSPPKTPEWAERISGIDAGEIRALARRMAAKRTLVTVTWSLQRADHGEQPVWAGVALAALLGQIGLPGGGFGHGYGSMGDVGTRRLPYPLPTLPQGRNPVPDHIPVALFGEAMLHPGEEFDWGGRRLAYPDLRLVYWCGGNPFHHHQDIAKLRRALARAETVVVHDPFWTPMARHADIVLPSTTTLERNDIAVTRADPTVVAMREAVPPVGESRNDYDIFADLAERLGVGGSFTEGRGELAWLEHLYETWRADLARRHGLRVPAFEEFWRKGRLELPVPAEDLVLLEDFRRDPEKHPLRTPSGRIEIFSATIDGFGYDDCPGHPSWLEPTEWLGSPLAERFPLLLISNQPRTRLHSQLDMGEHSQASKVAGREPIRLNPADAAARGIGDGDVVRVFNDRGSCLAGAVLSADVRPRVAQLSTGAWYDPLDPADPDAMCVHGNPNVLTLDKGTSRLTQGCSGQHALVEVERFDGPLPPVKVHEPPPLEHRRAAPERG